MLRLGAVLVLLLALGPGRAAGEENYLYHHIRATILVADAEAAAEALSGWADNSGGYTLLKASDRVVFRFPHHDLAGFRGFLEQVADTVLEMSPEAVDLRESILGIESGIRSREEILEKNLSYIDQADITGTLAIESEVLRLLQEVEQLKGKLRKLTVDRRLARGEVFLRFMEQSIPRDLPSSFAWINTVDFYAFMRQEF